MSGGGGDNGQAARDASDAGIRQTYADAQALRGLAGAYKSGNSAIGQSYLNSQKNGTTPSEEEMREIQRRAALRAASTASGGVRSSVP